MARKKTSPGGSASSDSVASQSGKKTGSDVASKAEETPEAVGTQREAGGAQGEAGGAQGEAGGAQEKPVDAPDIVASRSADTAATPKSGPMDAATGGAAQSDRHRKSSATPSTLDLTAKTVVPETETKAARAASEPAMSEASSEPPSASSDAHSSQGEKAASTANASPPRTPPSKASAAGLSAPASTTSSTSSPGRGAGRALFSAFMGAIIAVLVFFALISWGGVEIGIGSGDDVEELEDRVALLEQELNALSIAPAGGVDKAQLDDLRADFEAQIETLAAALGDTAADLNALGSAQLSADFEKRLDALSLSVSETASQLAALPDQALINQIEADLAALSAALNGNGIAGEERVAAGPDLSADSDPGARLTADIATLSGDIETLQQTMATLANSEETEARIAAVTTDLLALSQRFDRLDDQAATAADVADISSVLAAAQEAIEAMTSRLDAVDASLAASDERGAMQIASLDALATRLGVLEDMISTVTDRDRAAAAVAVSALQAALRAGAPFSAELDALVALVAAAGVDPAPLEGLRPFAASGLSTDLQLLSSLRASEGAILAAANDNTAATGLLDRLMTSAQSVVQIRAIGPVEGTSISAIISRLEASLTTGNLSAALVEFEALPEAARAQAEDFGADLRARVAADRLAADVMAGILAALAQSAALTARHSGDLGE